VGLTTSHSWRGSKKAFRQNVSISPHLLEDDLAAHAKSIDIRAVLRCWRPPRLAACHQRPLGVTVSNCAQEL
jgi:hypothetical protein